MQEYAASQVEELMCEVNEEQELEATLDEEEGVREADRLLDLESVRDPAWEWTPYGGVAGVVERPSGRRHHQEAQPGAIAPSGKHGGKATGRLAREAGGARRLPWKEGLEEGRLLGQDLSA